MKSTLYGLACTVRHGGMGCERIYEFVNAAGQKVSGIEQEIRIRKRDGTAIGDGPVKGEEPVDGLLQVKVLGKAKDGVVVGFWDMMDWMSEVVSPMELYEI